MAMSEHSNPEPRLLVRRGKDDPPTPSAAPALGSAPTSPAPMLPEAGTIQTMRLRMGSDTRAGMKAQINQIIAVEEGLPAMRAGLLAGDVVVSWDGEQLSTSYTLKEAMAKKAAAEHVLIVRRSA